MPITKPSFIKGQALHRLFNDIEKRALESGIVLKESDAYIVGTLCQNLQQYQNHLEKLHSEDVVMQVSGSGGVTISKRNPRLDYIKYCQDKVIACYSQLSMTPRSRGDKATEGGGEMGDGFDAYL